MIAGVPAGAFTDSHRMGGKFRVWPGSFGFCWPWPHVRQSAPSLSAEPPDADPHVLVVWQGRRGDPSPYADYLRFVALCLSLLQVVEVAADHPDLGLLGLSKYQAYFAGLPWCRHSATRSETFASPTHITVSAPPQ